MTYRVGIIGTGTEPDDPGPGGYAMAYHHARGYESNEDCELVACADIVPENAEAFASEFGLDESGIFEDYSEMLTTVEPHLVSICVPPAIHASIAIDCMRAESVEAIHCEKPMDTSYGGARLMTQEADRTGVQLTFNHQRRFSGVVRTAKELLDGGEIGELERVEFGAPVGLFDYGSHSVDLCNYFNDEAIGDWVMGQIDYREENLLFGAHNENQAVVLWEYENGVHGLGTSDSTGTGGPRAAVACHNRLVGTDGVIEVGPVDADATLRVRRAGASGWEPIATDEELHSWEFIGRALEENIRCLETGEPPELGATNALNATEIIFAAWESARRRGRVDLPLEIDDNPLEAMVDVGELAPQPGDG